ncbi:hypothetical protein HUW86_08415 (plasmid) [Fusobacterium sp. SB021]|uniref:hypothetical protein n=1 Tax=Fusobacterium sp. SB021 TaxID=2744227 RepID=UPI003CF4CFB3
MPKLTTMISVWLWAGIFGFIYTIFYYWKEIKKAKLDTIHFCVLFLIFCFGGIFLFITALISCLKKEDNEKIMRDLETIKEKIDDLVEDIRKS